MKKGIGMSSSVGRVKWFNTDKGYGFLVVDGCNTDVFLHIKKLRNSGIISNPTEGELYECKIEQGPKGLYAIDLQKRENTASA